MKRPSKTRKKRTLKKRTRTERAPEVVRRASTTPLLELLLSASLAYRDRQPTSRIGNILHALLLAEQPYEQGPRAAQMLKEMDRAARRFESERKTFSVILTRPELLRQAHIILEYMAGDLDDRIRKVVDLVHPRMSLFGIAQPLPIADMQASAIASVKKMRRDSKRKLELVLKAILKGGGVSEKDADNAINSIGLGHANP